VTAFQPGITVQVVTPTQPVRVVPGITLTACNITARRLAAIELAKRLQAANHYKETAKCA
jgi:hypothetical protein